MALTERIEIDKIEILSNGVIQVREAIVIERDGFEVARSFHRYVLDPGMEPSLDGINERVRAHAAAAWTPEVVNARKGSVTKKRKDDGPV